MDGLNGMGGTDRLVGDGTLEKGSRIFGSVGRRSASGTESIAVSIPNDLKKLLVTRASGRPNGASIELRRDQKHAVTPSQGGCTCHLMSAHWLTERHTVVSLDTWAAPV